MTDRLERLAESASALLAQRMNRNSMERMDAAGQLTPDTFSYDQINNPVVAAMRDDPTLPIRVQLHFNNADDGPWTPVDLQLRFNGYRQDGQADLLSYIPDAAPNFDIHPGVSRGFSMESWHVFSHGERWQIGYSEQRLAYDGESATHATINIRPDIEAGFGQYDDPFTATAEAMKVYFAAQPFLPPANVLIADPGAPVTLVEPKVWNALSAHVDSLLENGTIPTNTAEQARRTDYIGRTSTALMRAGPTRTAAGYQGLKITPTTRF